MQRKYSITDIELLAIVETLKEFKGMLWGQNIKVFTDHANLMRCSRLNLGPSVPMEVIAGRVRAQDCLYIKSIHNTMADAVSWLEYDPSVSRTTESFHTTKVRNKQSHQRQW
jgi:hypothetical protein